MNQQSTLEQKLNQRLQKHKQQNLYRYRIPLESAHLPEVEVFGKPYLNFCSNNYLGLSNAPELKTAAIAAMDKFGLGTTASQLICGHTKLHNYLEQQLAEFLGFENALLFSTGYMANLAIVTTLMQRGEYVFEDKLNHASLIDAANASTAILRRYPHLKLDVLSGWLQSVPASQSLIAVDSVFSMDGDISPIPELINLTKYNKAWLHVDDAHGFGVLGATGRGVLEHFNLNPAEVPIYMATLGKAAGCFGAFVAGSNTFIEALIQFSRSYIFTTALPPLIAAAASSAIELIQHQSWRREKLQENIAYFKQQAKRMELKFIDSTTPIQPLIIGSAEQAQQLSLKLREAGILVTAIRPPTVPFNSSRLRITLSSLHTKTQIDKLLLAIEHAFETMDLSYVEA